MTIRFPARHGGGKWATRRLRITRRGIWLRIGGTVYGWYRRA